MAIHIGTSGWAYASWKPEFYPPKLSPKKFLEYYASQLNSVEVNYTFRQLPSVAMLAGWLSAAGDQFTFSFKAPQRMTHFSRLKNCNALVESFYASLNPVLQAGRMGVVLYQLPPNFKADAFLLEDFLAHAAHRSFRLAFEFRHPSWFAEEMLAVLERHQVALCVAESDDLASPDVVTAPHRCYRLRKSDYTASGIDEIVSELRAKAPKGDVFAYFKHEEAPTGAIHARNVLARLREP